MSEFFADATVGNDGSDESNESDNLSEKSFTVVDTLTLARALHGAGTSASLESLSRKYNVKHKKLKGWSMISR
jgi:DNA polymerase III alpha subunit (gram-positive type)